MGEQQFSNSYMITNRAYPAQEKGSYIYPAPAGTMFYFLAPGANNSNSIDYKQVNNTPTGPMPSSYQSGLEADIKLAVQNGGPVTVYIHGLAYYVSDACRALGTYGHNLAAQGYKGLLIGFSWPSYGDTDSYFYYGSLPYSFPPAAVSGTIRDNIHGSTMSLLNLLSMLVPLCKKNGAKLNLLCHSEGNYMLTLAMYALSGNSDPSLSALVEAGRFADQVLLVAADINNGALDPPKGTPPVSGQGSWIAQYSKEVTVYWSSADSMLGVSDGWTSYHNPSFPKRLGLHGPDSFAIGGLLPNAVALDCSLVANGSNPHT